MGETAEHTIADAPDRERVTLQGSCAPSRCVPAAACPPSRPSCSTAPAVLVIVWLGRRRITGIGPGRTLRVTGPDRRPRGHPADVQPALRAAAVTDAAPQAAAGADVETVEQVVRAQLAKALGGRRGMVEAAVPTIVFTVIWLTADDLRTALIVSVAAAVVLLVVRLVQRSTVQFVVNALVRDRHRLAVRVALRPRRGERGRAGAGVLPARHPLQQRVRRADGDDLPDRLAARRVHGRQRHRRPDGLARRQADRAAVHPADLAAGAAVRPARRPSRHRSGWPATGGDRPRDRGGAPRACSRSRSAGRSRSPRSRRWCGCSARNHTRRSARPGQPPWSDGASSRSSSSSTSALTTNSSSSPASTGCSLSGV